MMMEKTANKIHPLVLQNGTFYLMVVFIALGLKYHYSRAGSEELVWILSPTAYLVEHISGIPFENEAHTGFVSRGYQFIIAPSCAGVNFLIMSFCMAVFSSIRFINHAGLKIFWLAFSLVCAYILTVTVNALRIIISIYSYNADIYYRWFTSARIHRLEGIVIYFFFLCLFYMIIRKTVHRIGKGAEGKQIKAAGCGGGKSKYLRRACTGLIPFFWYGLFSLGVPLFRGALHENGSRFIEHSGTVICASLIVLALLFLIKLFRRGIGRIMINFNLATPNQDRKKITSA